jgi:glucokinase
MPKAIGIDIGGTKIAVAAVDHNGCIRARLVLPTEAELGFGRAVERLSQAIAAVVLEAGWPPGDFHGIGIGCAGPVDPRRGLINNPYTLPGWDNCDIVTPLRDRFEVPVSLENDADAALLGEYFAGAGRGFDPAVMLTFWTWIGGAVLIGGQVYRGANGEHPELGHIHVAPNSPLCYCGIQGCLEALASGTAVTEAGRRAGLPDPRAVFAAARARVPAAQTIVDRALHAAATAAWTICHTFLPQRLILGGGLMEEHFTLFATAMQRRLATATQFTCDAVSIVPALLGNDAGLVGAASLVLRGQDPS